MAALYTTGIGEVRGRATRADWPRDRLPSHHAANDAPIHDDSKTDDSMTDDPTDRDDAADPPASDTSASDTPASDTPASGAPADPPVAVVTGANSGVGFHTTRHLVEYGWKVIMVCRSEERGSEARASIVEEYPDATVDLRLHDLASLDDVVALSDHLRGLPRLDALVNNAGVFMQSLEHTGDGFETTLGVNHVAHMLLTLRLEDRLRRSGGRVVNVSSESHRGGKLRRAPIGDILRGRQSKYSGVVAYSDSKLANVLFTREIVRRWGPDGAVSFALHPGVLSSRIWENATGLLRVFSWLMRPFMEDPEVGGRATAACVTDDGLAEDDNGAYLKKFEIVEASSDARDEDLAREVWEVTASEIRPWLERPEP